MKKYSPYIVRKEKDIFRIKLTESDLGSFQSELLLMMSLMDALNVANKKNQAEFKKKMLELKEKHDRARRALDLKYEERDGNKHTILFAEQRRVGIYDDEGRLIDDRPMSTTESQMDLMVESSLMEDRMLSSKQASSVVIDSPDLEPVSEGRVEEELPFIERNEDEIKPLSDNNDIFS